ncbi:hypothetical protein Tco_0041750, partial [Tanacetum coccineum]
MLEVITALAAEEAHSESTPSRAESSPRDTQSAAQASVLQDESQTFGGDEGLLDLYALNREVRRLKKQTISQAKQIHKLKAKLKKLSKGVKPLVKHHILWVKNQKLKKRGKKQKKKVSSVKLGRNKDEDAVVTDLKRKSDETEERKSDETEQVIIEEEEDTSVVKSPSSPIRPTQEEEPEEQFKNDEFLKRSRIQEFEKTKMLQERDAKRLLRKRKATVTKEQPSKKLKLRTETIDGLKNYLRIVDFEKSAQDRV